MTGKKNNVVRLTLPYPLSVNNYYARSRAGGVFLRPEVKQYRKAVKLVAITYKVTPQENRVVLPMSGAIRAKIELYPPTKGKRDLDNVFKCLLDAMMKAEIYIDDSQIKHIDASLCEPVEGGRVEVTLEEQSIK